MFLHTLILVTFEGEIRVQRNQHYTDVHTDVLRTTVPTRLFQTRFTNNTLNTSIIKNLLFLFFKAGWAVSQSNPLNYVE